MNRFAYRVYYYYKGPSRSDPFRSRKDPHEITEALRTFPNDLPHFLSDQDATVSVSPTQKDVNSVIVFVVTTLDEISTDEDVKRCLNAFDLFGEKLKETWGHV